MLVYTLKLLRHRGCARRAVAMATAGLALVLSCAAQCEPEAAGCGPCEVSADCAATDICVAGQCRREGGSCTTDADNTPDDGEG